MRPLTALYVLLGRDRDPTRMRTLWSALPSRRRSEEVASLVPALRQSKDVPGVGWLAEMGGARSEYLGDRPSAESLVPRRTRHGLRRRRQRDGLHARRSAADRRSRRARPEINGAGSDRQQAPEDERGLERAQAWIADRNGAFVRDELTGRVAAAAS
jgi:hypothetical protein